MWNLPAQRCNPFARSHQAGANVPAPFSPCPRCAHARVREMGQSSDNPPTSILRCEKCGHIWMPSREHGDAVDRAPARCAKCDADRMRFVGVSAAGVRYLRCEACDSLKIVAPSRRS